MNMLQPIKIRMTNMHYIIRIKTDWLRQILLISIFPFEFFIYVLLAWMPPIFGGHPNRKRLRKLDFYKVPSAIFNAAYYGEFKD